jgi:hypothetical protein
MRRILIGAGAILALAPAAGHGATARFTATFAATSTVAWDQPYGVGLTDCKGGHYEEQSGEQTWEAKSRTSFKVVVRKLPGVTFWEFPRTIEAAGMHSRSWTYHAGTTGGWCGAAAVDPPPDRDCGTRLPTYQVAFTGLATGVSWSASYADWVGKEKLYFSNCTLIVPPGMDVDSPPRLAAKAPAKALFNRRRKTIVVRADKDYGPESTPISSLGVDLTASGHMTWTLTLHRR